MTNVQTERRREIERGYEQLLRHIGGDPEEAIRKFNTDDQFRSVIQQYDFSINTANGCQRREFALAALLREVRSAVVLSPDLSSRINEALTIYDD